MTIAKFEVLFSTTVKEHFPEANLETREKRTTIFEARAWLDEETFIEVYFNSLTERKNYALVCRQQRVMGYDNYKFWHRHPFGEAQEHIPCNEPAFEEVIAEMKEIVEMLRTSDAADY
ncbi:MAG: hypothetical protein GTN71_04215 [Anaerolineae bacterium]|nr:hypothetical protein [Anaerolineae bacterium]